VTAVQRCLAILRNGGTKRIGGSRRSPIYGSSGVSPGNAIDIYRILERAAQSRRRKRP
jgi:hypothetical protein